MVFGRKSGKAGSRWQKRPRTCVPTSALPLTHIQPRVFVFRRRAEQLARLGFWAGSELGRFNHTSHQLWGQRRAVWTWLSPLWSHDKDIRRRDKEGQSTLNWLRRHTDDRHMRGSESHCCTLWKGILKNISCCHPLPPSSHTLPVHWSTHTCHNL